MEDRNIKIKDQSIEHFHRNYARHGTLSPDSQNFSLA